MQTFFFSFQTQTTKKKKRVKVGVVGFPLEKEEKEKEKKGEREIESVCDIVTMLSREILGIWKFCFSESCRGDQGLEAVFFFIGGRQIWTVQLSSNGYVRVTLREGLGFRG